MEPISNEEVQEIFSCSSIEVADSNLGIGRQLTYVNPPLRTVVFQTVKSDPLEYISGAIALILEIEEEWLLVPRYGSASSLQLIEAKEDFAAILFKNPDKSILVNYLCTRPTARGSASADLYVVSKSGKTLITWDHHTAEDGLCIEFQQVKDASQVLVALNEFGAELEVYYVNR
jgi:hypothetical protein